MLDSLPADPLFYAVVIPAVLMVGITKTLFGGGLGILVVPFMALVTSPVVAAAIMVPLLVAMDIMALRAYWRRWDWRNLALMLPGVPIGVGIGALVFSELDAESVRLILGLITTVFALNYWLQLAIKTMRPDRPAAPRSRAPLPRPAVIALAAMASFSSFVAHAGSPPAQIALLRQQLDKSVFTATLIAFFATTNFAKLGTYGALGFLGPTNLLSSLVLAPLIPIGIFAGLYLHGKIAQEPFYRILYALILLVGLKLIWDGVV